LEPGTGLALGAPVVLRSPPVDLAPIALSFVLGGHLSPAETVKLEAEPAVDSAVEALRQAKAQLDQAPKAASLLEFLDAQRTDVATKVEYIQDLSAYWNAVFQIEAATAMELVQ
jgi:hypothetical protein